MPEISVILPTRNEKDIIKGSMNRILEGLDKMDLSYEILAVDNSDDGTEKILKDISRRDERVSVLHEDGQKGLGYAVRMGIRNARGKYGIILMADSPDDIRFFRAIVKRLEEGYDLVHASRFIEGSRIEGYPPAKAFANRLCNLSVMLAFMRPDLRDFTNLFRGFSVDSIRPLKLESSGFDIGLEMSLKAVRKGLRIVEIPASWEERKAGKSKLNLLEQGPKYAKTALKVLLFYW